MGVPRIPNLRDGRKRLRRALWFRARYRPSDVMHLADLRALGGSDLRVSPLTLGTLAFACPTRGAGPRTFSAVLDRYAGAGGNSVDTADSYGHGRAESLIGDYLAARPGLRDRLVIATKFGASMDPGDPNAGGSGRKAILRAVDRSLKRLRTDHIDLYWQHVWDPHSPLDETMATLDDLVCSGKVRYVGLSDSPAWAIARAETWAEFRGMSRVAAVQFEYSLLERRAEIEQFGVVRALGLGAMPWGPLAGGVLTGEYDRTGPGPRGPGRPGFREQELSCRTSRLVDVLRESGEELGESAAAVALAWVRQHPLVTSTLIGVRTVAQLEASLASLDVTFELDRRFGSEPTPPTSRPR